MFSAVSKPITCLSLQCFFLGPLCDGYWQERGGRQNFPSLCRCCGQITICSTWSFVTSKWPALDSISSASLSPDFDRWQISSCVVIVSWYSSTFTICHKHLNFPKVARFEIHVEVPTSLCDEGQDFDLFELTANYKNRINSRWSGKFTTSVTELCHAICNFFKKAKSSFFCINWIPKMMVQFCDLRL